MDLVTRNGMNFLKLDRTVLTDEISRQVYDSIDVELDESDEMELFEEILFKYLESEKIDIHELKLFFNNLFNNYIKIFNKPKHYERKTNDRKNHIDAGFVDFKWDDSEIMANMVECAKRIEEFAKYLKIKGIDLDLQMIDFSPSNPIVKAAKDSEIEEVPLQSEIIELSLNDKIMEIIGSHKKKHDEIRKINIEDESRTPEQKWNDALRKLEKPVNRDEEIYTEIARILSGCSEFRISTITPSQLITILRNYDKLEDAKDEFWVYETKKFCIDTYKEKRQGGEYKEYDANLLSEADSYIEKDEKFNGLRIANDRIVKRALGKGK